MSDSRLLGSPDKINKLANTLGRFQCVAKFDQSGKVEAGSLAHAFSDLEDSFRKVVDRLLPKLVADGLSEADARDILHEIGEEFRHILYHIRDPKFYRYLEL
jgi:hypothetical protein